MAKPTLILPPRFTGDSQLLWRAAIDAGWDVRRLSWGDLEGTPESFEHPVIYGESFFAHAVAERLGVSLVDPDPHLLIRAHERAPRMVGRNVLAMKLSEACRLVAPIFCKPAEDKGFQAKVYDNGHALRAATIAFDPDLLVLVSDPVRFTVEYRFFAKSEPQPTFGNVLTGSVYIRDGDIAERDGAWPCDDAQYHAARLFAERVIEGLGPGWTNYNHGQPYDEPSLLPPAFVIDVGLLDTGEWAVVEFNPAWGAGICGANPVDVLRVLERATTRK